MIRQLSKWLLLALAAGMLLAACGGGSSKSTSSGSSTAAPNSAAGATTSSKSPNPTTKPASARPPASGPPSSAAAAEALAVCKSVIARAPELSAGTKAKIEGICNKAAHGDLAAARAAGKEVCAEVIKGSPIPAPAKAQALAACERSD
jgi:hypothetical protein